MRWSNGLLAAATKRLQASMGLELPFTSASTVLERMVRVPGTVKVLDGLRREAAVGHNPAQLNMLVGVPDRERPSPPLLVLLHGCQQDAATFARDTGWLVRARQSGAVLLVPEQNQVNNPSRCFTWFRTTDHQSGAAELRSIRDMIETCCLSYGCDRRQIYVVGLSAGGAMAAALMAVYPNVIAGGAVVAGLPVGCARSMGEALARMSAAGPQLEPEAWAERARAVAPPKYAGLWPRLSIWHGEADRTVDPANAALLAAQWRSLHGLSDDLAYDVAHDAHIRQRTWQIKSKPVVEWWSLGDFDHGYPAGPDRVAGKWVLPSPINATDRILNFFGL